MKKKITLLILSIQILLSLLFLFSCQKEEKTEIIPPLEANMEYSVGLKVDGFETRGLLTLEDNGTVHFFHTDPNSPLFTMEEVVSGSAYTADFQGIRWESGEVTPAMGKLYPMIKTLFDDQGEKIKEESLRGVASVRTDYENGENRVSFYTSPDSSAPIRIESNWDGYEIQINFELPFVSTDEGSVHNIQ